MRRKIKTKKSRLSLGLSLIGAVGLVFSSVVVTNDGAWANDSEPYALEEFNAPQCAGATDFEPQNNAGMAVPDTTLIFGTRLTSYNEGRIVPLYDAFGGSVLINAEGQIAEDSAAYPPICGTRYEPSMGGPVSEWMFCTDRHAMSCADTNKFGQLVDSNGDPVEPMEELPVNPKLSSDQERLISYLIHHGHTYDGVGDQSFRGVDYASASASTSSRAALQTLVWCISDPSDEATDFAKTCALNLPVEEQERLLNLIPTAPELKIDISTASDTLSPGDIAKFEITTNIYNQPIDLTLEGTADPVWSVCEGDAEIVDSTLYITGTDASVESTVSLCATAENVGSAEIEVTSYPPSTEHIEWSQGNPTNPDSSCQVYATFHKVNQVNLTASAFAEFLEDTDNSDSDSGDADSVDADAGDGDSNSDSTDGSDNDSDSGDSDLSGVTEDPEKNATQNGLAATGADPTLLTIFAGMAVMLMLIGLGLFSIRKEAFKS